MVVSNFHQCMGQVRCGTAPEGALGEGGGNRARSITDGNSCHYLCPNCPLTKPSAPRCFCCKQVCIGYPPQGEYCMYKSFWEAFSVLGIPHTGPCAVQERHYMGKSKNKSKRKLYIATEDERGVHIATNNQRCIGYLPKCEYGVYS